MLLRYSLHVPRRGWDDIRNFIVVFRQAFPDLNFWGAADLIAEGDYVVGRWEARWYAHRTHLQRLPNRLPPDGLRPQDALYGDDRAPCAKRQAQCV
jgi:hypothetical protein